MLAEVRQDNKENDAEHMKPVSPSPCWTISHTNVCIESVTCPSTSCSSQLYITHHKSFDSKLKHDTTVRYPCIYNHRSCILFSIGQLISYRSLTLPSWKFYHENSHSIFLLFSGFCLSHFVVYKATCRSLRNPRCSSQLEAPGRGDPHLVAR